MPVGLIPRWHFFIQTESVKKFSIIPAYNCKQRFTTSNNGDVMRQREMAVLGDIKRNPRSSCPMELVKLCKTKQEAIQLCVKWSGIQYSALAEILGIDKGNFTRMMTGSAQFPHNKENQLQDECGNEAILDWINWSRNKKAIEIDNSERLRELEAELNQLKGVA